MTAHSVIFITIAKRIDVALFIEGDAGQQGILGLEILHLSTQRVTTPVKIRDAVRLEMGQSLAHYMLRRNRAQLLNVKEKRIAIVC